MSLFFLHPLYLYGLFAASLPVVIHLLNRRKLKRIRFPAVRFVLLSQKRISRSYRLRHWWLLALRTLAVTILALLLANPVFQTGAGLFAGGGPLSLVIIVDNSLSMTWSGEDNGFKQAKETARLLVSSLNDNDRAAIIPTSGIGKEALRLKSEKEVLLRDLDALEIAAGTANFSVALSQAYELLNQPAAHKEIRLITDMALTGWDDFNISSLKQYDPLIPVKLLRTPKPAAVLNGTIKEIRLTGQCVGVGLPITLEAAVANFGDKPIADLLVQLTLDRQSKEQKLISIPPRGETSVRFPIKPAQAGSHFGSVTLKKDGFAGNPTSYFAFQAHEKLKVLVVDGDPQTSLVQSETFFLTRALNPAGERDSSLYMPTVVISDGLAGASLDAYQVVILCNVAGISDALIPKLQAYVKQGGGLLVFAGDRVQAENFNLKLFQSSPSLLPAQLREKKIGPESSGEKIDKIDLKHPALQGLADPLLQESIKSARVWGYYRLAAPGKSALITLGNGDPFLMEQKISSGRVMLLATAADRDWSDLPLKTAYLPLVQSLTNYLAGGKRGIMDSGIPVGAAKEFSFPPSYVGKNLKVTKPNGQELEVPLAAAKERASATIKENEQAGIYRLTFPAAAEEDLAVPQLYAVNSPFLESRLEEIGERELKAKLRPISLEVIPIEALQKGGKRMDIAITLLGFLIVTLLLEGWLAQRI